MPTYTYINSYTVPGGGQSIISFTNIPQTYTDLVILGSAKDSRTNDATNYASVRINGNTTSSQKYQSIAGTGGANIIYTDSDTSNPATVGPGIINYASTISTNLTAAGLFGNFMMYFPKYTSNSNKILFVDSINEYASSTVIGQFLGGMMFQATAAITSIDLGIGFTGGGGGTYQQHSSFYLYGISGA